MSEKERNYNKKRKKEREKRERGGSNNVLHQIQRKEK